MTNIEKTDFTTTLELVKDSLEKCHYAYDPRTGWNMSGSVQTEKPDIMASRIRNYLETKQSPYVPPTSTIGEYIGLHTFDLLKEHTQQVYEKIKYHPEAKDESEKLCRLISGDNYHPTYPAIIRQWIWCVKNRIQHREFYSPIFPILYGGAGIGKSRFIRSLCSPLPQHKYAFIKAGDSVINSEKHTAMLHDNLVIHIDEMSGMKKADLSKLKTLDAMYVSYIPLYTNTTMRGYNEASLIGASNTEVRNILSSTDDIRKWVQVNFYEKSDESSTRKTITAIESFDYLNLWQSVNENGAEPFSDIETYEKYNAYVKEVCSSTTPSTDFLDEYLKENAGKWVKKTDLFRQYENEVGKYALKKDTFYELCHKRGLKDVRQPGTGQRGYEVPDTKTEEEWG